jgi:hypothetical protein
MLDTTDSFDSDFSAPADWARMYRSLGLQVVPAPYPMRTRNDKRPSLAKWREFQDGLAPQAVFDKWFPDDAKPNMGVITGGDERVLVIDLDDYKGGEAAAWFSEITLGVAPETWQQTTGGGGRQVFYRLPEGVSIGNCRTANGIDIRCQAGFAMLPPSLHMSGKCYEWVAGSAPWDCELDTAPPHIIRAVQELIIEHGGAPSPSPGQRTASPGQDFNAFGQQIDGREEKMTRIVWAVVVGLRRESDIFDTATGFAQAREEAWQTYFRTVKSRLPGTDQVALLEKEGRGPSLFNAKWAKAISQWDGKVKAAAEDPKFIDSIDGVKFDPETGEVIGEEPKPRQRIELIPWDYLPDINVRWLIKDFLPYGGFAALYGKPGSYKSFVALYIAACVASEMPAFGRETTQGDVIYIAGEGGAGLKKRRDAFMREYALPPGTSVHFVRAQLNLRSSPEDANAVIEAIRALDLKPALIIIDTLARAFAGGNENASEDMGAFIAQTSRLQEALGGPTVLVVHHSGKDEARGMRGHSALLGAVDTELEVVKDSPDDSAERFGHMTVTKQKDGEDGFEIAYGLKSVALSDIDPSNSSLVVVPADVEDAKRATAKHQSAGPDRATCKRILAAINDAWNGGRPWSSYPHSRRSGRYAPLLMKDFGVAAKPAENLIEQWLMNDILTVDLRDKHSNLKGLKVIGRLD